MTLPLFFPKPVAVKPGCSALAVTPVPSRRRANSTVDKIVALYGLVSELGPIATWNLDVRGGRIEVDTSNYESSRPGIFAVGDIANYPNKQKLILSGFHEASLALRKAYSYAYPEKKRVHVHSSYDAKLAERVNAAHATGDA